MTSNMRPRVQLRFEQLGRFASSSAADGLPNDSSERGTRVFYPTLITQGTMLSLAHEVFGGNVVLYLIECCRCARPNQPLLFPSGNSAPVCLATRSDRRFVRFAVERLAYDFFRGAGRAYAVLTGIIKLRQIGADGDLVDGPL